MNFVEMIKNRRSVYALNKDLPVFPEKIIELVRDCVRYVPDAFDMKSQRALIIMGEKNTEFFKKIGSPKGRQKRQNEWKVKERIGSEIGLKY